MARRALVERYTDGECLTFAFAVHWMTGFPVEALSERGSDKYLHFAAIAPDGRVWDADGPRDKATCAARYADGPEWRRVDAMRLVTSQGGVDEEAVTEALKAAVILLGPALDMYVRRLPEGLGDAPVPSP